MSHKFILPISLLIAAVALTCLDSPKSTMPEYNSFISLYVQQYKADPDSFIARQDEYVYVCLYDSVLYDASYEEQEKVAKRIYQDLIAPSTKNGKKAILDLRITKRKRLLGITYKIVSHNFMW